MNIFNYKKAKELREEKDLPLSEIAAQLNVQPNVYARYERGITAPDLDFIKKLAEVLTCSAADLFRDNITVIDGYVFSHDDVAELDGILKMIPNPEKVSAVHAIYLLKRLNKIVITLSLERIVYSPVDYNTGEITANEVAFQQNAERVYARFKYVYDILSQKILPELPPLMQKIKFPHLKEPHRIPLINNLTDTLLKFHERHELLLPDFSQSQTIVVFSDYGGDSGKESFYTYSFLFADYDSIETSFDYYMQDLRRKYFTELPEKEIAFKNIKHGHIKNSLWDYLCAAGNSIHGLLFTLVIDHRIKNLFGDITENAESFSELTQVKWKPSIVEKLFRVDTVIAYFLTLLGHTNQKVFWFADDDAIMESEEKANIAVKSIISLLYEFEEPVQFELYGYGKNSTFCKIDTSVFTDALSLTDVVGGAVNHYLTLQKRNESLKLKPEAEIICKWLNEQNLYLKKISILITADDRNLKKIKIGTLKFRLKPGKMPSNSIKYINILYPTKIVF